MPSKNDSKWVPWAGDPDSESWGAVAHIPRNQNSEFTYHLPAAQDGEYFNNLAFQIALNPAARQQYATAYYQGSVERAMLGIPAWICVPAPHGWWPANGLHLFTGQIVYADGSFTTI